MPRPIKWILGFTLPIVVILCLLSFGNPQWGKWVYMWQTYVITSPEWPGQKIDDSVNAKWYIFLTGMYLANPHQKRSSYSGEWKHWNKDGQLECIFQMVDGELTGDQLMVHDAH